MFRTRRALAICAVSEESYRHWKRVLKPLSGRDGREGSLTFAELVSLAIIQQLKELGVPVSKISAEAQEFFDYVADRVDAGESPACIYLSPNLTLGQLPEGETPEAIVTVRIDLVCARIRRALEASPDTQRQLNLLF